jgi:hypothetical protein
MKTWGQTDIIFAKNRLDPQHRQIHNASRWDCAFRPARSIPDVRIAIASLRCVDIDDLGLTLTIMAKSNELV